MVREEVQVRLRAVARLLRSSSDRFRRTAKIRQAYALQRLENQVIFSYFSSEARDEYNRSGIFSHNIVIPDAVFLGSHAPILPLVSHFITDITAEGELPLLSLNPAELPTPLEPEILAGIKPGALERIIECILGDVPATVVCPDLSTMQMLHQVSAVIQLLPQDARIVTFITAPLGRSFRQVRSDAAYNLKLVQNRSIAIAGTGEHIDLSQETETLPSSSLETRAAWYFVENFRQGGYEGLKELHSLWEKAADNSKDRASTLRFFVRDMEINRGLISVDVISSLWKKRQKQEAKNYVRAIIDRGKWGGLNELIQLCTLLLEDSKADLIKNDIAFIVDKTSDLKTEERTRLFDGLVKAFPKLRDIFVSNLTQNYSKSMLIGIKDLSSVPSLSSILTEVKNYDNFRSMSGQILAGAIKDATSFQMNLKYLMAKIREKYSEQAIDYIHFLITTYPDNKGMIIEEMVKEDFLPTSLISRMPRDIRQQMITRSAQILELVKSLH